MRSLRNTALIAVSLCALISCAGPKQRREQFVVGHPGSAERVKDAVLRGAVFEGMSMDAVRASWGNPSKKYTRKFGSTPALHCEYEIEQPDQVDTYLLVFRNKKLIKMELLHSRPK